MLHNLVPYHGGEVAMPPSEPNPTLLNRRAAFDVFDVAHDGTINAFELTNAFMGCDDVRSAVHAHGIRTLRPTEIQEALDRLGIEPGSLVTFNEFNSMCDIMCYLLKDRKESEERRAQQRELELKEEVNMARAGSPASPRGDKAIVTSPEFHPELGPIQRAFYAFDIDHSGTVSGHEVPRMLRLVGVGPKGNDRAAWDRFEPKWHKALADIWPPRLPTDLLNVYDFHDMCLLLDPNCNRELPERPRPPPVIDGLSPEEIARLEAEERARREEEERRRREEEERIARSTLHVKTPSGHTFGLPETTTEAGVMEIMRRIEEVEGIPIAQQRLVAHGWEMSTKKSLKDYGVKIGHPQRHKGHIVTLLVRQPPAVETVARITGNIYVRSVRGEVWTVLAKSDDSVGDLQRRVAELTGIPIAVQRIVANGRELAPFERLRDAQVCMGDTVLLLVRDRT